MDALDDFAQIILSIGRLIQGNAGRRTFSTYFRFLDLTIINFENAASQNC